MPAESLTTAGRASKRSERFASRDSAGSPVFAAPALICVHAPAAADPDIWWHLRRGANGSCQAVPWPHVDAFSGRSAEIRG